MQTHDFNLTKSDFVYSPSSRIASTDAYCVLWINATVAPGAFANAGRHKSEVVCPVLPPCGIEERRDSVPLEKEVFVTRAELGVYVGSVLGEEPVQCLRLRTGRVVEDFSKRGSKIKWRWR